MRTYLCYVHKKMIKLPIVRSYYDKYQIQEDMETLEYYGIKLKYKMLEPLKGLQYAVWYIGKKPNKQTIDKLLKLEIEKELSIMEDDCDD